MPPATRMPIRYGHEGARRLWGQPPMNALRLALAMTLLLAAGCAAPTPASANPAWVDQLIQQFKSEPVGNPPQSITRYEYNDQVVYYVPAQCCDMYSTLYDAAGSVMCAPDGGIDGRGDLRCPDFQRLKTNEMLIWQDSRTR